MKKILVVAAVFGAMVSPAIAVSCDNLVLNKAIAFTLKIPKEKWYGNSAQTTRFNDAERSAKAWIAEHPKGKEILQRAKDQRRQKINPAFSHPSLRETKQSMKRGLLRHFIPRNDVTPNKNPASLRGFFKLKCIYFRRLCRENEF